MDGRRLVTWDDGIDPPAPRMTAGAWLRVALRGTALAMLVFGGLLLLILLRLVERPLFGLRRSVTPWITQGVCKGAFVIIGLRREVQGAVMRGTGAVVANHSSWLDIFALNASKRIYFVSKSEVAAWPGIGWLARATGTVFIRRDPRDARQQKAVFEERLRVGHRLLFFPEGTSTDGLRVLPFKTTLFAAFFSDGLPDMQVQPVTLAYHAPPGEPATFYGWWGGQGFGEHLLRMLAAPRHGRVEVIYHPPLRVADHGDRKALARAAERAVRDGMRESGLLAAGGGPAPRDPRTI
ncbi:lysophospholipid acyltransferase family protein [Jannaschia rubra]|uniref:2-acyl-glycerophospho-ethanolamine acyltransferase n=2 Tax=Jannaschia rubra TaxID=282197 RepID=A0A0M6XU89_9RHOB|nr:lysophospholipid acyltransferase family protein [Jannaschia rubra]CTQ34177.1 2-acyl-glycerophospho-ethanolamine acyltransferase [Jannaschia rubra]SFG21372.1 lyso-ornithine lipid acyltransferase [Jannaschia rubra]